MSDVSSLSSSSSSSSSMFYGKLLAFVACIVTVVLLLGFASSGVVLSGELIVQPFRRTLGTTPNASTLIQKRDVARTNLVLCKIPKVGGTTMAGVGRRVGEKYGLSGTRDEEWITREPGVWMNHMKMGKEGLAEKIKKLRMDAFVFTVVREPVARVISNFQFTFMDPKHSEKRVRMCVEWNSKKISCKLPLPTTKKEIEDRLLLFVEEANINEERDYCLPAEGKKWSVHQVMDNLDFVGVTERFDESLIVIKEIFNLDYSDILYLSAKVVEYDWLGTDKENSGENILSPRVQAKVEQMMEDSDDHKLWRIANERLDVLESEIPDFKNKLETFTKYKAAAQKRCKVHVDDGNLSQCLYHDHGCGEVCLNEFARDAAEGHRLSYR